VIPYEVIIPSASRPHLLARVLQSFFVHVDQPPVRVLLHDDACFPGKAAAVGDALHDHVPLAIDVAWAHDDPPIKHGFALHWLLSRVTTPYVLYMQDDHEVVRDLPVRWALNVLDTHRLNQIRFNKRDTLDKKGRDGEEFFKVEQAFGDATLCAADHWYFQCGVWRVSAIKPIVDWWATEGAAHGAFGEHCEVKINQVMNGQWNHITPKLGPDVPWIDLPELWNKPEIRARVHKTFIWGRIGEPRFVEHIGHLPEDWALERANRDPQTRQV
jgi:hypothetical protein